MRLPVLSLCALLLVACDDADDDRRDARHEDIASRPAPNPQRVEIRVTEKNPRPTSLDTAPRFLLFSRYDGRDIRQVTGVSGRTLWLCFTAEWCPHSARMTEELNALARAEKGGVQIVQVDADTYPALAEEFNITKVPTTVLSTEGVRLRTIEGAFTADSLRLFLHRVLTHDGESANKPDTTLLVPICS